VEPVLPLEAEAPVDPGYWDEPGAPIVVCALAVVDVGPIVIENAEVLDGPI
jgi:hypothetical protein